MIKKRLFIGSIIVLNILAISAFIIWLLNRNYPIIGHDYRLFMPYMLDSFLHQKINGLTVQWYTPSFAGGRPVFANPQDLQFSLPQFLLWLFPPWVSILLSICIFMAAGFLGMYFFLKDSMGLGPFASILGAVFFAANGFFFEHMAAGHVTYQLFPLFAVLLLILFHPRLSAWPARVLFALTLTLVIYDGIHNIPFFILSALILLPLLYLLKPALLDWKRMTSIAGWGGLLALLICASRISAVIYFMRFFPRLAQDNYSTNMLTGSLGILRQLLGTMNLAPIYLALHFINPSLFIYQSVVDMAVSTGTHYGYWELDASLSPVLFLLLAGGIITAAWRRRQRRTSATRINIKKLAAVVCLVLAVWIVIEFTLAKGLIYPLLRNLPILASLQVNVRNCSAFILSLALLGAVVFDRWTRDWKAPRLAMVFVLCNGMAIGFLATYHWIPTEYAVVASYKINQADYRPILDTYNQIRLGNTFPVKTVIPDEPPWLVFEDNATSTIDPYNAYFKSYTGYETVLHAGPVTDVTDGRYNIIDPTGYIFPEANGSAEYSRIPADQTAQFLDFINRRQPRWNMPQLQKAVGWISPAALGSAILLLILYPLDQRLGLSRRIFKPKLADSIG